MIVDRFRDVGVAWPIDPATIMFTHLLEAGTAERPVTLTERLTGPCSLQVAIVFSPSLLLHATAGR
ncbi:MAG: hypothetical protein NVS3B21_20410 [Acidimicrobiales bacterium]